MVAELRELAGHRPDLLAEEAGLALSHGGVPPGGELNRMRADLCIKAGAEVAQVPSGSRLAGPMPYTGAMHPKWLVLTVTVAHLLAVAVVQAARRPQTRRTAAVMCARMWWWRG